VGVIAGLIPFTLSAIVLQRKEKKRQRGKNAKHSEHPEMNPDAP